MLSNHQDLILLISQVLLGLFQLLLWALPVAAYCDYLIYPKESILPTLTGTGHLRCSFSPASSGNGSSEGSGTGSPCRSQTPYLCLHGRIGARNLLLPAAQPGPPICSPFFYEGKYIVR